MNYNLSRKNAAGKSWCYGRITVNKWGNPQASFKVSALKDLIELAEKEGKEWVNLSLFENKGVGGQEEAHSDTTLTPHSQAKANAFVPEHDLSDEIPF